MGFKENFLALFRSGEYNFLTEKQILSKTAASSFDRKVFSVALRELVEEGELAQEKGKFALPERMGLFKGKFSGNAKGFGFFIRESGDDWFVPPKKTFGAMHGDTVLCKRRGGDSTECEITAVCTRANTKVVGTFESRGKYGFLIPDDRRLFYDIHINEGGVKGCKNGQKAVALITSYPDGGSGNPSGTIIEVLGDVNAAGTDILSIIRAFNLYEEFSKKTADAAKKVPSTVSDAEIAGRRDFRDSLVITIDGADAKDLDDAVSLETLRGGGYRLYVHIADVAHYVPAGGAIDKEAYARGTSVYFPDRVLPMLPRELSNGICSLHSGADKLTLSAIINLDDSGKVLSSEIAEGVINTTHRMTYDEVTEILEGESAARQKYSDVCEMIFNMAALSGKLTARREARGAVDFEIPECKIELDERGRVVKVEAAQRSLSNRIIEEFMLLANEAAAETYFHCGTPFIYRVHETPTKEKTEILRTFLEQAGVRGELKGGDLQPKTVQHLINSVKNTELEGVISRVTLRAMQKARYSETCLGHFGLASKYYCHFTSPIRRYPDLVIHRIIKDHLKNGQKAAEKYREFVAEAAKESSQRERLAEEAEREVDNLKKAEYMSRHIGAEYSGVISGVQDFGFFVELENTVEGLVRLENMPPDRYTYIEGSMCLRGADHSYRIGGHVTVKVFKTDLNLRKTEFSLI